MKMVATPPHPVFQEFEKVNDFKELTHLYRHYLAAANQQYYNKKSSN